MLRGGLLGVAACAIVFVACSENPFDSQSEDSQADAGVDSSDEPPRPERPDASPEDLLPDAGPEPCVEGDAQLFDSDTGHCYARLDGAQSWINAQGSCVGLGMHLVSITSDLENELVRALIGGREAWTGGNDIAVEGDFTWNTGEAMVYERWRGGEPNNTDGVEHCVVIQGNQAGAWDDRPCGLGYAVVCERDF